MDYIKINKLITTSIYKQIASSITKAIDSGLLKYNEKLPTEKEICESFSTSATAGKMAYDLLISEGKIKRIKGKGTYVTNRLSQTTHLHTFFEADVLKQDSNYSKEIILLERSSKEYSAYRALKLKNNEKCYKIAYLVKSQTDPILLQKVYLPWKYFSDFKKKYSQFDNLYEFVEKIYDYKIKHLHSTFNAINASSAEALLLGLEPDDAIYFVRTQIIDTKDRIIGYICSYYPGEFTRFEVTVNAI